MNNLSKKRKKDGEKKYTTQRVDIETLIKIKTLNYHLLKSRGIKASQSDIISSAINYAIEQEADFIEYMCEGSAPKSSALDLLIEATGKPWFPYGNLVKIK